MSNVINKRMYFLKQKKYNRLVRAKATKNVKIAQDNVTHAILTRRLAGR